MNISIQPIQPIRYDDSMDRRDHADAAIVSAYAMYDAMNSAAEVSTRAPARTESQRAPAETHRCDKTRSIMDGRARRIANLITRVADIVAATELREIVGVRSIAPSEDPAEYVTEITAYVDALPGSRVAIVACSRWMRELFPDDVAWLNCGAILICDGLAHRLTIDDIAFETASTRVLLSKDRNEVAECTICCDRPMAFACRRCWTSACRKCFAACSRHAPDHTRWTCPQCRSAGPIRDVVAILKHDKRSTGTCRAFAVIHDTMRELGVETVRVSIEARIPRVLGAGQRSGDAGTEKAHVDGRASASKLELHRASVCVRRRRGKFVKVECQRPRLVEKMLFAKRAEFVVGEVPGWPAMGARMDFAQTAPAIDGRAFAIGDDGVVLERIDMFASMCAYVRSWDRERPSEG